MSLKHAILGFLSLQSMTGYDLKKHFDSSVQHFWNANQSQIYRTLAELDEQGLVGKEVMPREGLLDIKIYYLSETGRQELHRWLATPLPLQETREPLLIQIFFGNNLSDAELLGLLKQHVENAQQELGMLVEIYRMTSEAPVEPVHARSFMLRLSTLEYGIEAGRALLRWLEDLIRRVEAGDYTPRDIAVLAENKNEQDNA